MHNHCHHKMAYCYKCDVAYCEKCSKEWGQRAYYTYPYYSTGITFTLDNYTASSHVCSE